MYLVGAGFITALPFLILALEQGLNKNRYCRLQTGKSQHYPSSIVLHVPRMALAWPELSPCRSPHVPLTRPVRVRQVPQPPPDPSTKPLPTEKPNQCLDVKHFDFTSICSACLAHAPVALAITCRPLPSLLPSSPRAIGRRLSRNRAMASGSRGSIHCLWRCRLSGSRDGGFAEIGGLRNPVPRYMGSRGKRSGVGTLGTCAATSVYLSEGVLLLLYA